MMKKTFNKIIAAVTIAAAIFTGCKQNEGPINKFEEGLPVSISFKVEVPEMQDITVTRASDDVETSIEKMAILFYNVKQANSKPIIVRIDDLGQPTKTTSTNWLYTINLSEEQLDGVYSGEWWMYPIANYDKYATFDLSDLANKTLAEFKEYTITASGRDITSTAVMMSGRYGSNDKTTITLQPGSNTFDNIFHLKRIVSKNIFTFENGAGVTFTPQKYSIHNYSTSSTLLERTELNGYAGNGTFTDFTDLPVSGNSFTFYMPENVQIPIAKESAWTYADREKRNKDDYNEFTYAPTNSTYIVVEGTYSGPGENGTDEVTGNVKYTIHLGDFGISNSGNGNFDNFNVTRNAKYSYKITVKGVKSIIAEAKRENENQPGAEGQIVKPAPHVVVNLDAHYENVLLSFSSNDIEKYYVSATTPGENGVMVSFSDPDGDKASHISAVSWVKFGKPYSTTEFNNYPGDANVTDIYTLIEEVKKKDYTHCLSQNEKVYVQAYVNEYFYDDEPYKNFVNADDRVLSFTIGNAQISEDGHSTYIEGEGFTLKQKSIKTIYNDNAGNPFGLESKEETPAATFSSDTYGGEDLQNGLKNTWEIINSSSSDWNNYVNIASNGFNGATAPAPNAIMTSNGTNPMYECLSRNRDLNGDGKIDHDEIRWYLPAFRQYIYIWCGKKALPSEITFEQENYVSSTNAGYRVWWAKEGTAISSWGNKAPGNPMVRCARNLGTSNDGAVSDISDWNEENKVVTISRLKNEAIRTNTQTGEYPEHENFDAASTLPKAFKIAKENLNIPASAMGTENGKKTFKYTELMTGNWCEKYYSEEADGSDLGKWRIPNEKELYFIQLYCGNEFKLAGGKETQTDDMIRVGAKTKYERTNTDKKVPYMIYYIQKDGNSSTPIITTGDRQSNADFTVRCVRDYTPSSKSYDSSYNNGGTGFGL